MERRKTGRKERNKKRRKKKKREKEKISKKKEFAKVERNDEGEILMEKEKSSSREKD